MGTHGVARWLAVAALIVTGLGAAGCTAGTSSSATGDDRIVPAKVEAVPGKSVKKVTLSEQASRRLGIQTVTIAAAPAAQPSATVVPYRAVLYDPSGGTWVYTVAQSLTYLREKVVVASVGGAGGTEAVLSEGPAVGTTIVSIGVIELYGAELGVGK
jgi:hypothetical protein